MSDEDDFQSGSEEDADFSASEDEWLPTKEGKKKAGKKSKTAAGSSDEEDEDDEDGSTSPEDSDDLENFANNPPKKKGAKQTASRKRSAAKATSPKQATGGAGNKRKRLTPGLRDRLYQQYKSDLLKEIAPAKAPLNSSVTDILDKCQYQRKPKSVADDDDSDSSGDDHLVNPEKLDLGAKFFSKRENSAEPSGSAAAAPPHFDVNAGMRLSDSSAEEGEGDRTNGEESLPASIPKRAADRLISHLNQQSGEYMNFTNLDQFTAKVEEAKRLLKSYQQREQLPPAGSHESTDAAASSPTKGPQENVSNLLAMGEKDGEGGRVDVKQRNEPADNSSDSEWEEVQTGDGAAVEREEEASKPATEPGGWQVTIEMETAQSRRKRREEIEMELYIKREINRVKRKNQLNYHKASVLGAICIGQRLNRIIETGPVRGLLMSLMQGKCAADSKVKWDDKKMQSFAAWYKEQFELGSNDFLVTRNGCNLGFVLSLAIYTRKVACRHDYVLLFLACLRLAGVQARLVLSANVPPKRPALSDLCPMSERQIKEKLEKRQSNGNVPGEAPAATVQKESTNAKKDIPPLNAAECKESNEQQSPRSPSATKENPAPPARRSRRHGNNDAVTQKPIEQTKGRLTTRRKALSTLNIPQLDGGDDRIVPSAENNNPPAVTRSLRSRSVSTVPRAQSPVGSSPFARRQSNTPTVGKEAVSVVAKPPRTATRKRKLFAAQPEVKRDSPPPATRTSARKKAPTPKEVSEPKVKRRTTVRSATASGDDEDDAFELKPRPKSSKSSAEKDAQTKATKSKVPKILLVDVVKSPEAAAKSLSPQADSKSASSDVKPKTSATEKQPRRRAAAAAARKKSSHATDGDDSADDSDFELPKESSAKVPRKRTASAKKSPRAASCKAKGEQEKQRKTDLWIEFYSDKLKRWLTFDLASEQIDCVDLIVRNASSPISYVFAWDNAGHLKDVTARYVKNWNTACRMLRVEQAWLDVALRPLAAPDKTEADLLEAKELNKLDSDKPLPKTISELKNHPLYALRRHLLKFEALYPAEPPTLGFIRGEAIYPRECVHTLQTREKWYKQGRVVRAFETAYKVVKCWKYDRPNNNWLKDQPCDIFGYWQTDEFDPPTAENGLVPRNEYGNVELFTEKMLPKGTVHLKLPGLNKVCKRLQIDCAPALTGFDMAKMRVVPVYEGFVVCKEFAEQAVEEWYKEMEKEEVREQERLEKRVYGNWKRLIKGLLVRRKLQNKYNFDNLAL